MKNSTNLSLDPEKEVNRVVKDVRCDNFFVKTRARCNNLLTRVIFVVSLSEAVRVKLRETGLSVSQVVDGVELKVGTQTKCRRCKQFNSELNVI